MYWLIAKLKGRHGMTWQHDNNTEICVFLKCRMAVLFQNESSTWNSNNLWFILWQNIRESLRINNRVVQLIKYDIIIHISCWCKGLLSSHLKNSIIDQVWKHNSQNASWLLSLEIGYNFEGLLSGAMQLWLNWVPGLQQCWRDSDSVKSLTQQKCP